MDEKIEGDAIQNRFTFPKNDVKRLFHSYWSSPEKFAAQIEKWNPKDAWCDSGWNGRHGKEWYGTSSMDECINLVRYGWKEGGEAAQRMSDRIRAKYPLLKQSRRYGIVGSIPSVPRAVAGDPKNMQIPDYGRAKRRPIITYISNAGAPWTVDCEEFLNRAAVVAAIVDQTEAAGYACDVIVYCHSTGFSEGETLHTIQVKSSDQPVDIQRLAFGLGHTSLFRRMIFAEKGIHQFNKFLGDGLGYQAEMKREGLPDQNIYVIEGCYGSKKAFKTPEDTETKGLNYLISSLKKQGCPPFRDASVVEETKEEDGGLF